MKKGLLVGLFSLIIATGCGSGGNNVDTSVAESDVNLSTEQMKEDIDETESVPVEEALETSKETVFLMASQYENDKVRNRYEYDAQGNLIKEEFFYPNEGYIEYQYNSAGLVEKAVQYSKNLNKESKHTCYEYDSLGNMISSDEYVKDAISVSKKYFYEGTNLVREESYKNGENTFTATYKYDEKGNMIEQIHINTRGVENSVRLFNYDEDSRLICEFELACNFEGERVAKHVQKYEYNEKGQLVAEYHSKDVYKVDEDVDVDHMNCYITDEYIYDEKGNLIDNNEFEENGKLARNKHYEYVEITR